MTAIGMSRPGARPGLRRRIDLRLLFGIGLFVLALGATITGWRAGRTSVPMLVAARDLPAGHTLGGGDLAVADVRLPAGQRALSIPASAREQVVGRVLTAPAVAGELPLLPGSGRDCCSVPTNWP